MHYLRQRVRHVRTKGKLSQLKAAAVGRVAGSRAASLRQPLRAGQSQPFVSFIDVILRRTNRRTSHTTVRPTTQSSESEALGRDQ